MSRRRRDLPRPDSFPPPLKVFDVGDWWVRDQDDELEVRYARIRWGCARRAYLDGDDWQSHLGPPAWWPDEDPKSQTRSRGEPVDDPDP